MKHLVLTANSLNFILDYKLDLISSLIKENKEVKLYILIPNNNFPSYQKVNYAEFKALIDKNNFYYGLNKGVSLSALLTNIFKFVSLTKKIPNNEKCYFVSHTATINLALFFFSLINHRNENFLYRFFITGFGPSRIRRGIRSRFIGRIYIKTMQISSALKRHKVFVLNTQDREIIQDYKTFRKVFLIRESNLLRKNLISSNFNFIQKPPLDKIKIVYLGRYLLEKGICDLPIISFYLNIAGIKHSIDAYGSHDPNNSSSLTLEELKKLETPNLKFRPSKPFQEVFRDSHVFLFPSAREGHPRFVLEAIFYQCIPIVSPNPGLDVDVVHLYNGLISATSSPSSLAASIIEITKNENLYNKLKSGCRLYTQEIAKLSKTKSYYKEIFSE